MFELNGSNKETMCDQKDDGKLFTCVVHTYGGKSLVESLTTGLQEIERYNNLTRLSGLHLKIHSDLFFSWKLKIAKISEIVIFVTSS